MSTQSRGWFANNLKAIGISQATAPLQSSGSGFASQKPSSESPAIQALIVSSKARASATLFARIEQATHDGTELCDFRDASGIIFCYLVSTLGDGCGLHSSISAQI